MQMNITWLKIPTGRRQTSWLFTNVAEETTAGGQSGTWTHDLRISSPVYGGLKKHTTNAQNMIGQSAADTGTAVTWAQLFSSTLM